MLRLKYQLLLMLILSLVEILGYKSYSDSIWFAHAHIMYAWSDLQHHVLSSASSRGHNPASRGKQCWLNIFRHLLQVFPSWWQYPGAVVHGHTLHSGRGELTIIYSTATVKKLNYFFLYSYMHSCNYNLWAKSVPFSLNLVRACILNIHWPYKACVSYRNLINSLCHFPCTGELGCVRLVDLRLVRTFVQLINLLSCI